MATVPKAVAVPLSPSSRLGIVAGFFAVNLLFLIEFADRDGYEGDDINSVVPTFHLEVARHGLLLIYRYAWQPLAYELSGLVWRLTHSSDAIFLLSPVCGAITLAMLLLVAWRDKDWPGLLAAAVALLAVPEFWYSSLYYNSSMLGLPWVVGAILLLDRRQDAAAALVAGVLGGAGALFRLDFILFAPMLALLAWWPRRLLSAPLLVAAGGLAVLLLAIPIGLLDIARIIRIQAMHAAETKAHLHSPGWDRHAQMFVLSTAFSPLGWVLLLCGGPLVLIQQWRRIGSWVLLWLLAALPLAYPMSVLLSDKYALPLAISLVPLFVRAFQALIVAAGSRFGGTMKVALIALALVPCIVSLSLYGHRPFVQLGLTPARPIGTHDGPRGYGGYIWQMAQAGPGLGEPANSAQASALLAELHKTSGPDLLIVGNEDYFRRGGLGWRRLQLALVREGIEGRYLAPHTLQFTIGGRRLLLMRDMPAAVPAGYRLLDLRDQAAPGILTED
jgi:hypothetical protein